MAAAPMSQARLVSRERAAQCSDKRLRRCARSYQLSSLGLGWGGGGAAQALPRGPHPDGGLGHSTAGDVAAGVHDFVADLAGAHAVELQRVGSAAWIGGCRVGN